MRFIRCVDQYIDDDYNSKNVCMYVCMRKFITREFLQPSSHEAILTSYLVTSFQQPGYLADLISPYSQSRLLRSSTQKLLSVPPHNLDTAARRFSVAAPRLWNSLLLNCRTALSVNTFKICLKTFLFDSALPHCSTCHCRPTVARYKLID